MYLNFSYCNKSTCPKLQEDKSIAALLHIREHRTYNPVHETCNKSTCPKWLPYTLLIEIARVVLVIVLIGKLKNPKTREVNKEYFVTLLYENKTHQSWFLICRENTSKFCISNFVDLDAQPEGPQSFVHHLNVLLNLRDFNKNKRVLTRLEVPALEATRPVQEGSTNASDEKLHQLFCTIPAMGAARPAREESTNKELHQLFCTIPGITEFKRF